MPYKKLILFLFGLIQTIAAVHAQESFMRHYTVREGLPSNTVYRMAQDDEGYIWVGNEFGASRFDGKSFQNFSMLDGLSDNEIIYIKKDSKGRVWFFGFNGTVSYWYKNKFYNEHSDTLLKHIKTNYCFMHLFEDKKGRIWFLSIANSLILDNNKIIKTNSSQIYQNSYLVDGENIQVVLSHKAQFHRVYERGRFRPIALKYSLKLGGGMVEMAHGNILFSAKEGLILQQDTLQTLLLKYPKVIANSRYIALALSRDSLLWITSEDGLYSYDFTKTKTLQKVYTTNSIFCNMFIDPEDNIWIGTLDDGIYMLPGLSRLQKIINVKNGLPDNHCYAIHKKSDGKVLVGMRNNMLVELSPNRDSVRNVSPNKFNPEKIDFIVSKNEHVWIIANSNTLHKNIHTKSEHLINFKMPKKLMNRSNSIKGISYNNSKLFLATNYEIFSYALDSLSINKCKSQVHTSESACEAKLIKWDINRNYNVFIDHYNTIWYGCADGIFTIKNGQNKLYLNQLPYKRINSIYYTTDSLLIVGTHGFGVFIYKNKRLLEKINTANGLANNLCRKLLLNKGKIYVATPSGLSIIHLKGGKLQHILNLNESNLLPSNVVNDLFVDDKEIGVATPIGLVFINQDLIKNLEQPRPKLNLVVTESEKGTAKFTFQGIYFLSPDAVNYRYRLKQDQEWNLTTSTQLEFPFLESGQYRFEVQARVNQGTYSPSQIYSFVVYPPFWKKWWFVSLTIILVIALLSIIIQKRINYIKVQQAEKLRVKQQLIEMEQQALLTMMNPHFIFNVMNSIQHFINQNNAQAANQYLSDFAKLIRMNLNVSVKKYIPIEEELTYLNLYLSFEQLRFGSQLSYHIWVDPTIDTDETTIAAMMIQPFLENAIWHGILPAQIKGEIKLSISKISDNLLEVSISDNGIGISSEFLQSNFQHIAAKSHGLNLTFKRLDLLCKAANVEPKISFQHLNPASLCKGTLVQFLLPAK